MEEAWLADDSGLDQEVSVHLEQKKVDRPKTAFLFLTRIAGYSLERR